MYEVSGWAVVSTETLVSDVTVYVLSYRHRYLHQRHK